MPALCKEVDKREILYDRWPRTALTVRYFFWMLLDIPCGAMALLMAATLWRLPTLLRMRKSVETTWHRRIAVTFFDWACDIPFVLLCCIVLPWRLPFLAAYLWRAGTSVPDNRFDLENLLSFGQWRSCLLYTSPSPRD